MRSVQDRPGSFRTAEIRESCLSHGTKEGKKEKKMENGRDAGKETDRRPWIRTYEVS